MRGVLFGTFGGMGEGWGLKVDRRMRSPAQTCLSASAESFFGRPPSFPFFHAAASRVALIDADLKVRGPFAKNTKGKTSCRK
jgi:hypothetical protein